MHATRSDDGTVLDPLRSARGRSLALTFAFAFAFALALALAFAAALAGADAAVGGAADAGEPVVAADGARLAGAGRRQARPVVALVGDRDAQEPRATRIG